MSFFEKGRAISQLNTEGDVYKQIGELMLYFMITAKILITWIDF